jgi:hypothetical protein
MTAHSRVRTSSYVTRDGDAIATAQLPNGDVVTVVADTLTDARERLARTLDETDGN